MYHHVKRESADPKNPQLPVYYGTFEMPVEVGGKIRRMLAYAPDGIRESTAGILVLGENGQTADDLLQQSGWREIAEQEECKEKLIVFFLEPENGAWRTGEPYGLPGGDVAYINAAAAAATERYLFCVHESKVYLVGSREGGVMAHMAAMWNPAFYAGICSVGGSVVDAGYMAAAGKDLCIYLHGFTDEAHTRGLRKGEIPLPAWIIDDPGAPTGVEGGALDYWRNCCGTGETPRQLDPDVVEYFRTTEPPWYPNQEKEAYRVRHSSIDGASADCARPLQRRIWKDFLYRQRRWMSSPGGDLRETRDPVRDLGMDYYCQEVDGWTREWYVYLPRTVRERPQCRVPLVVAMHGYTCTGEIYAGNSDWHKVADKHGFIVVFPTALHGRIDMENHCVNPKFAPLPAWNVFCEQDRPDELHFFSRLLDRLSERYPVDPARVFATGHSWGSLMTQMLALAMPERFAAVAPCSGVFFGGAEKRMLALPAIQERPGLEMPVWMHCGEEEGFLIDAIPANDNATGFTISLWLRLNGMADQIPPDWTAHRAEVDGRWRNRFFSKGELPMVRFTSVIYMPHATMTEMSFRIWQDFFCRFARDEHGTVRLLQQPAHRVE